MQLDVRRWQRDGYLRQGGSAVWKWTNRATGEDRGSIGFRVLDKSVALDYSANGRPSAQTVTLTATPCTFGGSRTWFVCPIRGERVAVLYMRFGRFACRHCQRLAYGSQSGDVLDRSWRRQYKVEARLGPHWQRPKGMHQTTHSRLMRIIWDCEEQRDRALAQYIESMRVRYPFLKDR